jgi:glutathione synthase/RimK-type ligase-like ATP-grasp enzyme
VRWNAHKRYLLDLDRWNVPVVPTAVVQRANPESLASVADRRGWRSLVVKPAVSAGAKRTGRFDVEDPAGERALAQVLTSSDALVQPYLNEIEVSGESSLVVMAGVVAHAVSKVPSSGDFRVQTHHGGRERAVEPTDAERELASLAWEAVESIGPLTYARVDCLTVDGRPHLMEMEVIEPSLYLAFGPETSADAFIDAVMVLSDARR